MKLPERLIPALVAALLVGILAPLCVAAGLDGCGDSCCELAAQISSAGWMKVSGAFVAALGAVALVLGGGFGFRRFASAATPCLASSLVVSAVPLRI